MAAQMFPCPHQPGSVQLTPSACAKMWLKAQAHPVVERWRKKGKRDIPNNMIGTSLGECLDCAEGCANAAAMRAGETLVSSGSTEEKSEMESNGNCVTAQAYKSRRATLSQDELEALREQDRQGHKVKLREKYAAYLAKDGMKRCRRCEEVRPVSEYRPHKTTLDGYRTECEVCGQGKQEALKGWVVPQPVEETAIEPTPSTLTLPCEARDLELYQRLTELARMERRSPEQQVMWILERFFSEQGQLVQGGDR